MKNCAYTSTHFSRSHELSWWFFILYQIISCSDKLNDITSQNSYRILFRIRITRDNLLWLRFLWEKHHFSFFRPFHILLKCSEKYFSSLVFKNASDWKPTILSIHIKNFQNFQQSRIKCEYTPFHRVSKSWITFYIRYLKFNWYNLQAARFELESNERGGRWFNATP